MRHPHPSMASAPMYPGAGRRVWTDQRVPRSMSGGTGSSSLLPRSLLPKLKSEGTSHPAVEAPGVSWTTALPPGAERRESPLTVATTGAHLLPSPRPAQHVRDVPVRDARARQYLGLDPVALPVVASSRIAPVGWSTISRLATRLR